MLSEINHFCETYDYVPVLTEAQGLAKIAGGAACLGIGGILKAGDCCTGRKTIIPYISDDAARFHTGVGIGLLKEGVKQILPATGLILVIYVMSKKTLNSGY